MCGTLWVPQGPSCWERPPPTKGSTSGFLLHPAGVHTDLQPKHVHRPHPHPLNRARRGLPVRGVGLRRPQQQPVQPTRASRRQRRTRISPFITDGRDTCASSAYSRPGNGKPRAPRQAETESMASSVSERGTALLVQTCKGWFVSSVKSRRGSLHGSAESTHARPPRQPCRRRHGAWHTTFVF